MTTNLHRLPEPVPEGWALTNRPGWWFRRVGNVVLQVQTWGGAYSWAVPNDGAGGPGLVGSADSLSEACAAAERAFCGCYAGAVVPRPVVSVPLTRVGLAADLKRVRETAGLTQGALARRLGVTQPTVSRIESAHREPDAETIAAWAHACGMTVRVVWGKG